MMDLELVPWGNAKVGDDGTVKCQHGPEECTGNTVLSCAMDSHPTQEDWFLFAWCCESHHDEKIGMMQSAQQCAGKIGWDFEPIRKCVEGARVALAHLLHRLRWTGFAGRCCCALLLQCQCFSVNDFVSMILCRCFCVNDFVSMIFCCSVEILSHWHELCLCPC